MLEPALVNRPGRIDQAIEFPLPTLLLRRRIIALYAHGLSLSGDLIDTLAQRTEGASPAFIKLLLLWNSRRLSDDAREDYLTIKSSCMSVLTLPLIFASRKPCTFATSNSLSRGRLRERSFTTKSGRRRRPNSQRNSSPPGPTLRKPSYRGSNGFQR